ncbi:MAG TPA: hypothetical protein HA272_04465 [Methanoregula sp.]|nr:hypothetical protein [Methanoregula sp.]
METGDILTLVGGLFLVLVIAFVINPQYLSDLSAPVLPEPTATPIPRQTPAPEPVPLQTVTTDAISLPATPRPDDPPYQIFYSDQPFSYPRFKLPENMRSYGASDIPLRTEESVPFAFVTESRGGLTQKFLVPYPLWVINTTVIANRTPQYGNFKMVLCYANNGTIIEGEEILNRGSSHRIVQTSNVDLYMIITTAYIDRYYISLETPRSYYNAYRP